MRTCIKIAALSFIFLGSLQAAEKFERAIVFLERNAQDEDAEVKFEVTGGETGIAALKVSAPDGRTVIDFKSPDSKLGIRHLSLESPEPKNDGRLQKDFPAGKYAFVATTTTGTTLQGEAILSHKFPDVTSFVHPTPDANAVSSARLQIKWRAVKSVSAYILVIVQEATGREVRANLSPTTTSFFVPEGFLIPSTKYKLEIGTVLPGGNKAFIETQFSTDRKR